MSTIDYLSFYIMKYFRQYFTFKYFLRLRSFFFRSFSALMDFPGGSDGKASVYNVRDPGSIPGSGRSAGEGNGNPLQYYCLENPIDRGAW